MFKPLVTKKTTKQAEIVFELWYWEALIFEFAFIYGVYRFLKTPNLLIFGLVSWCLIITLTLHVMILIGDSNLLQVKLSNKSNKGAVEK